MSDHLLQDQDRGLTNWLASKPDARLHAREAAQAIVPAPTYSQWRDFYAQRITTWLTAAELRAEVAKLTTGDAPSAELLLVHAMRLLDCAEASAPRAASTKFARGDMVRKVSGSAWSGRVVGEYSTTLTPEGYAVESDAHPGSVQIYPAKALLKLVAEDGSR